MNAWRAGAILRLLGALLPTTCLAWYDEREQIICATCMRDARNAAGDTLMATRVASGVYTCEYCQQEIR